MQTTEQHSTGPKGCLLAILVGAIGALVLVVWAFVGLYLWIPLLIRTAFAFSASVVGSVISGHSIANAERALNEAIVLYAKGFSLIMSSLRRILSGDLETPPDHRVNISWKRCVIEFILATVAWAIPFAISATF